MTQILVRGRDERASASREIENKEEKFSQMVAEDSAARQAADAASFVAPKHLRTFMTVVIIANAVQLGACVQGEDKYSLCFVTEVIFTFLFALEMCFKLHAQGRNYFRSKWNALDFTLAWLAVLDISLVITSIECTMCTQFSLLRLLRLLRTLRLFRVLHARRELAVLAEGLGASLKAMVWVATLLGVLVYAGAIFCVGAFGDERRLGRVAWEETYFDNLSNAMLTLFNMSLLDLWEDVVRPLSKVNPLGISFFVCYIFVASFGILNLLIGIITESTTKAAIEFEATLAHQRKLWKMHQIHCSVDKVFEADDNKGGTLSVEEIERVDQQVLAELLDDISLPPGFTVADLHLMISPKLEIDKNEFIQAMKRNIFCSQFQRDCMFQHAINDIRRRFTEVESILHEMQNFTRSMSLRTPDDEVSLEKPNPSQSFHQNIQSHTSSRAGPFPVNDDERTLVHSYDAQGLHEEFRLIEEHLKTEIRAMRQELQSDLQRCWSENTAKLRGKESEKHNISQASQPHEIMRELKELSIMIQARLTWWNECDDVPSLQAHSHHATSSELLEAKLPNSPQGSSSPQSSQYSKDKGRLLSVLRHNGKRRIDGVEIKV